MLKDFGMNSGLRGIYFNKKGTLNRGHAYASMNGLGDLHISTTMLSNGIQDSNGYSASDSYYGLGAHEAGHAVVNGLLQNYVVINPNVPNKTSARQNLERATARSKGKLDKAIIKEAAKRFGSNPPISGYGSTSFTEKVAEAVSDVYANKTKAKPYSKTIVAVMKDIQSGKFKPTIRVSDREMGI